MFDSSTELLLKDDLDESAALESLAMVGFTQPRAACRRLRQIAGQGADREAFAAVLPTLLVVLSDAARPDDVLIKFEHFTQSAPDRLELFRFLVGNPRAIEMLVTLYVRSEFLSEIMRKNPSYLEKLAQHQRLGELKGQQQFFEEAQAAIAELTHASALLDGLRRFQRWELLRIGACDLFGLADLKAVTVQLSLLADALVQSCLKIAVEQAKTDPHGFAVVGMGKLGGEELNYSSDIDLIFISQSDPQSFRKLGQQLIRALNQSTPEGFLYRVDMRLRPWGRSGELVTRVDGYIDYLHKHAMLWEKQALLKARVIAGDVDVGSRFLQEAEPLIFSASVEQVRTDVHRMKQQIEADLRRHGRKFGEVKLGEGSIRDVEFVAQYLQLAYGAKHPEIRTFNTLDALVRLADFGLLDAQEYRILTDGYVFLRTVEHSLQLMHYKQAHSLPETSSELNFLARRLDFQDDQHFLEYYQKHSVAIRAVYQRHFSAENQQHAQQQVVSPPAVEQSIKITEPSYEEVFSSAEIQQHREMAERINESHLVEVSANRLPDGQWRITIVGPDHVGQLSLICGLLFAYGVQINDGCVFSHEVPKPAQPDQRVPNRRRRHDIQPATTSPAMDMVAVLKVHPTAGELDSDLWSRYADELTDLLQKVRAGQPFEAQGELAKSVAVAIERHRGGATTLLPISIEIDNEASDKYTVLHIGAPDTIGFLYELTNALALNNIDLGRVLIHSAGNRVFDTLYITDMAGKKITDPAQQRELRTATVLIKQFTQLLPHSPNPESALLHFRQFVEQVFSRPDWTDEIATLAKSEVLDALARLLGVSDFLWEDFLRMQHENLFPVVRDVDRLESSKTKQEMQQELQAELRAAPDAEARRIALNAFKDREMFRADMRHILGHVKEFGAFASELTDVAEVVVEAAYELCEQSLRQRFGDPRLKNGAGCPMTVCALGKCGGRELGFASDIELMFLYAGTGKTTGPQVISTGEFYRKLVEQMPRVIAAKRKGIFELDLRLRPYGRAGSLAVTLHAFQHYFAPSGAAWPYERQALVKLRPICGDADFGAQIMQARDECIYTNKVFDATAMRAMRQRQLRELVTAGTFNAKLSLGGLVDVEYLVQGLQMMHGHKDPQLRATNTRTALAALQKTGILTEPTYRKLDQAYIFFRPLIDALRMVRGDARDLTVPPVDSEEFQCLARRLGYDSHVAHLHDDLMRHSQLVQEMSHLLD